MTQPNNREGGYSGVRRRTVIPTFATSCSPTSILTWTDRLVVKCPRSRIHYRDPSALREWLRSVGRGPLLRFAGGQRMMKLSVRSGWVFGGEALIRPAREHGDRFMELEFRLNLNPTRFLVHNDCSLDEIEQRTPEECLREVPALADEARAYGLDGNDNVMVPRRLLQARSLAWNELIAVYLRKVSELIESAFFVFEDVDVWDDTPPPPGIRDWDDVPGVSFDWSEWVVRQVETYWEFETDDAVGLVRSLEPHIREISRNLSVGEHDVPRGTRHSEANAVSLSVDLGAQGVRLGIYAKASARIRFEVRQLTNPRRTYGTRASTANFPRDDLADLPAFLAFVSERAHDRACMFIEVVHQVGVSVPPTLVRLSMLLGKVARACEGDASRIHQVLVLLMSSGRIVRHGDAGLCAAIDALEANNVLTRRRITYRARQPVFSLVPVYAGTVGALATAVTPRGTPRP